jgi:hypothetical protein
VGTCTYTPRPKRLQDVLRHPPAVSLAGRRRNNAERYLRPIGASRLYPRLLHLEVAALYLR